MDELPLSQADVAALRTPAAALAMERRLHGRKNGDANDGPSKAKMFNDPVHGHFRVDPLLVSVIDTPQFQRLRDLKQLGTSHFVFPGAVHTRFDHSLGVAHLSDVFVRRIEVGQKSLNITFDDIQVVRLAGLVHDLGHGPFSHVFDNEFLPAVGFPKGGFVHEKMSCDILDLLVDENNIDIDKDTLDRVKEVVMSSEVDMIGPDGRHKWGDKGFLCEFVANGRNSIDVDKFDYMMRDCFYSGVKASCDFSRLMEQVKVIGGEMCWKASEADNIYELFHTRASLHRRIYTHKKAKAIEFMVTDALAAANPVLRITDKVSDPRDFWKLDDTVLKQIEQMPEEPALEDAKGIMHRIRTRDLYTHVNEVVIPPERLPHWLNRKVLPEEIITCTPHEFADAKLTAADVRVNNMKINYCKKDAHGRSINPVDCVRFFSDMTDQTSFLIPKDKVSSMMPAHFEERRVRVYCSTSRKSDDYQRKCEALAAAFEKFQEQEGMRDQQVHRTPLKQQRKRQRSDASLAGPGEDTPHSAHTGTYVGDRQRQLQGQRLFARGLGNGMQ
eukprot:PRCOL_00005819-RA